MGGHRGDPPVSPLQHPGRGTWSVGEWHWERPPCSVPLMSPPAAPWGGHSQCQGAWWRTPRVPPASPHPGEGTQCPPRNPPPQRQLQCPHNTPPTLGTASSVPPSIVPGTSPQHLPTLGRVPSVPLTPLTPGTVPCPLIPPSPWGQPQCPPDPPHPRDSPMSPGLPHPRDSPQCSPGLPHPRDSPSVPVSPLTWARGAARRRRRGPW